MNKITVILGPTSSGKTSLAIDLCKKFGGEIISADSRQVYKKADVGTGKIPVVLDNKIEKNDKNWVVNGVKIWGYDLVEPDEYFSAYDYANWALPKADKLLKKGIKPLLVGGTGFYIDLFTGRIRPSTAPPDFKLRKKLEKMPLSKLQKKLTSLNLTSFERVDSNNPVRLIRAIEVEIGRKKSRTPLPYLADTEFDYIGLSAERKTLYARAGRWVDEIWKKLLDETGTLLDQGYSNSVVLQGLVYKSVVEFIKGEVDEEHAKSRCKFDLHAYIRRQQTWFKKNEEIDWYGIENDTFAQEVADHVQSC